MSQGSNQDHLTQSELAERWRISPRTLEKWRYLGIGVEHLKIGGRVIYRVADVRAYEAAHRRGHVPVGAVREDGAP
jgi:hypothetical protein